MRKMVNKVLTTFAPAENSTFVLNGWFMHTQSHIYIYIYISFIILYLSRELQFILFFPAV